MKIKRIEQTVTLYQGKLYIEGKIQRNLEDDLLQAKRENEEDVKYMWRTYGEDWDFLQLETELLF